MLSEGDSDSSLPSPIRTQYLSSDMEASGEESEPRAPPGKTAVWVLKRQGQKVRLVYLGEGQKATQNFYSLCKSNDLQPSVLVVSLQQGSQVQSPEKQHWYGSEEFLALPAQLHKTEMLALKLESLARSIPLVKAQPGFLASRLRGNEPFALVESVLLAW